MEPPDFDHNLGFLIPDISRMMVMDFNKHAEKEGLTSRQWRTLAELFREEGLNQGTLADALDVQPITMTRIVDRLEEAGWVERRPDPNDRRAVTLHSTDKAGPLHEKLWRAGLKGMDALMSDIPDEHRKILFESLLSIKEKLATRLNDTD
jgi:DNA-binding MarR family transcriptional regulator